MWSQIVLCLLVGLAAASNNGWKSDTEYKYQIRGRTLTGLHDVDDQYSGIVLKADLFIQPHADEYLYARIQNAQYAQVHAQLSGGWDSEIPESQLSCQPMTLTQQPFQIKLKNGIVEDLIVSKQVPNWEANIIKSIVSQIQLDTQAENVVRSSLNQLPEEGANQGVYKTMEETVTGKYQTLYDINPLPEYVLQSKPHLVPFPHMRADGEIIDIVKTKNFSDADELTGYHYGFGSMGHVEPSTSHMGDFFLRSSVSRAVITGNLKRYTLQSSVTVNKVILSPTWNNKQKGMVVSRLNLTLSAVQPATQQLSEPSSPISLKSLVYRFDRPFTSSNEPRPSHFPENHEKRESAYSSESSSSSEEHNEVNRHRQVRSLRQQLTKGQDVESLSSSSSSSLSQSFSSVSSEEYWQQDEPKLNSPPEAPLLPYYVGYKGKSIKSAQNVNIVQAVQKIAQQIGQDLQRPQQIPKEQTLAKYTILSALTRIMNQQEMQEVASQLYNKDLKGVKSGAWKAYRDAIAECGTGPALLTIQDWIQNMKIRYEEAAEVIASVSSSVRQPTDEYIRTFYNLVKKQDVRNMPLLNDTAILSFCNLVRRVYVNKYETHNQYPVHTFGSFRSKVGVKFITEELIPYLSKELERYVAEGDSHKIIVYIRALGNVAHQRILNVFEPYLEGQKQISQFQRLQMVLALDKLVKVQPKVARSVLYKIYQNIAEAQEVRAAAVYQLMRTAPSSSMLQRMAEYTNIDTSEQVNAAVKSSIQSAAELEGTEFDKLRTNARAARSLLTPKEYGFEYSKNYLRSYIVKEMNLYYKKSVHTIGSEDSWLPRGLIAALRFNLGGIKEQIYNVQYMISSVEELTNVFRQQTERYHKQHEQQKQHDQEAQQHQWSAEHIARMLNIETEEREQLESSFLFHLGDSQRLFTLNNRTVELLPKVLREIEETLRSGKEFEYTKFFNRKEMAISFPTEMGLPFIYTFDVPTVIHINGHIKASAEPQISNGHRLHAPNDVKIQSEIRAVLSKRVEAKLGFITPFDHQHYSSGYDKNMQFYIPIKSEMEIDVPNQHVHLQFQPIEPEQNTRVFQYSTWPYTAKSDILNLQPIANRPTTHVIETKPRVAFEQVIGKQCGLAFRLKYNAEQLTMDKQWFFDQFRRHDFISAFMTSKYQETMQKSKITFEYLAEESQAKKVHVRMGYDYKYNLGEENMEVNIKQMQTLPQQPQEYKARREHMVKMASSGIKNAHSFAGDFVVEFEGQQKVHYIITSAVAKSNVDEKSRVLFYYKKHSANHENKPYEIALIAKTHMPNTNGLDFNYALKFDPKITTEVEFVLGENLDSGSKFNIHTELHKSDERKMYLQNLPQAHQCLKEMEQGNHQLPACANMTAIANLMDRFLMRVKYEHLTPTVRNITYKAYNALRYLGYFYLDENRVDVHHTPNQLNIEARFRPDFKAVNVTFEAENMLAKYYNIRVNDWARRVFVVHPVFPVTARVNGKLSGYHAYRPFCVVDHTAAKTFDNKTYPIELGQDWTVMMQYVPRYARYFDSQQRAQKQEDREHLQNEQYVVLVRDSKFGQQQKDVRLTLRTPRSNGQLVEIELYPTKQSSPSGSRPAAKVIVNKKEQHVNDKESIVVPAGIEIYALPNGEVKVEILKRFYIIYDGQRVKLTSVNDKFRDSVRGLCGTFTGEQVTDFRTPKNCILRNPHEFAATYAIVEQGSQSKAQQLKTRAEQSECYYDELKYANVISRRDAGFEQKGKQQKEKLQTESGCTRHQFRYVVDDSDNTVCFSTHPLPVCKSSCKPKVEITKNISMHCVQRSSLTDHWQKRIDEGANPGFNNKQPNKSLKIQIPQSCAM